MSYCAYLPSLAILRHPRGPRHPHARENETMKQFRQNRHREPNSDQFGAGTTANGPHLAEVRSSEGATPRRREGALASRVDRDFYRTWVPGLLPAKYLMWFVIYLAATASSVGVPSVKCRKPTSIRDPKKTNDGGREGISSDQPVRRQRLLRAEQPKTDA